MTTWLNIMGFDATQLSRWDRLDGAAAVEALAGALRAAGLPDGQLEAPMRLLAQAEDLAGQARQRKTRRGNGSSRLTGRCLLTARISPGTAPRWANLPLGWMKNPQE